MIDAWIALGTLTSTLPWLAVCAAAGLAAAWSRGRLGLAADLVIAAAVVMAVADVAGALFHAVSMWIGSSALASPAVMFAIAVVMRLAATASMLLIAAAAVHGRLAR